MGQETPKKKRGPEPDRLKIEEDPGEALDCLLGVSREPEPEPEDPEDAEEDQDDGQEAEDKK